MKKDLWIYDTLTATLKKFEPINPDQVLFYACGVTVYDLCHVGHARVYVTTDAIRRVLAALGFQVKYVQNFTDIDDKIIQRATARGISTTELTTEFIQAYFDDMAKLNIMQASVYPKATDYVDQMIQMIQQLVDTDHAYPSPSGDVWYAVDTFAEYGKLSKKNRHDLEQGVRIELTNGKRHPHDFVLWKSSKPGEPFWDSPWGPGRPGWHIECSAMVFDTLGQTIDIHAGGEDLVFPHHENEICQSESVSNAPFAQYWIHNGFVTIKDEKMSKSTGNFFTLRDILAQTNGAALRFFLLKSHYRSPLQFSFEGIQEAQVALEKLFNTVRLHANSPAANVDVESAIGTHVNRFWDALCHDFNFAEGIGVLFDLSRLINATGCNSQPLDTLLEVLGLERPQEPELISSELLALMEQRWAAKKSRDFKTADALRDQLLQAGITIEDAGDHYRWKLI